MRLGYHPAIGPSTSRPISGALRRSALATPVVSECAVADDVPLKLSAIDLNLLVVLDALLREPSVTKAGKRVGLSQPATSHALGRLRELFGDPLLVREGRRMHHTELAQRLAPRVRRVLSEVEATLAAGRSFDPATSQRAFRIATNDYCGTLLLPSLVARFAEAAPGCSIDVHPLHGGLPAGPLERGELDMVLGTYIQASEDVRVETLFEETFSCLVPRGFGARLSLQAFAEARHLLVANPGYGPGVVDIALAERGLRRHVAARVPHFMVAPAIAARSGLVLTLPTRIAKALRGDALRLRRPPLPLQGFEVQMLWPASRELDPGATWLRQLLRELDV